MMTFFSPEDLNNKLGDQRFADRESVFKRLDADVTVRRGWEEGKKERKGEAHTD